MIRLGGLFFIWVIFVVGFINITNAAIEFNVKNQERIDVSLSSKDINRVAVINDRIKAIYGPQDKAHIVTDEENGQIFVTPKERSNKSFSISIVTESNQTVDLSIWPIDKPSETVLLHLDKKTEEEKEEINKKQEFKIKKLIRAALNNAPLKGYQVKTLESKSPDKELKNITPIKSYIGSKLKAQVINYKNLKTKNETISEQMFQMHEAVVAVAINKKTLKPNEVTRIIIVESDDKR